MGDPAGRQGGAIPLAGATATRYDEHTGESINRMPTMDPRKQTRLYVQAALAACEDKKAEETRVLELDPIDSGLTDYFLITTASNERQAVAIADEIEFKLKKEFGLYANSVEGRRQGEWILLDYVDFVVHVFQTERRAFYDIERLRKSARPLTPAEFDIELKADLAEKTRATRSKQGKVAAVKKESATKKAPVKKSPVKKVAKPVAKSVTKKAAAGKVAKKKPATKKVAAKKVSSPSAKKATAVKKIATAKKVIPAKKAAPVKKVAPAKKAAAVKKVAASNATSRKKPSGAAAKKVVRKKKK